MKAKLGFAEINGARLYYDVTGSGSPLVLIHGFMLDTRMWDDQFGRFAEHHRVIRYDARGFGRSSAPVRGDKYRHEDDLEALLDHLGVDEASVLGLSMGGRIAIDFAVAYPERTRALIPVDSAMGGYVWSKDFRDFLDGLYLVGRERSTEVAKDLFLTSSLLKPSFEKPTVASKLREIVSGYSGWHLVNDDPQRALSIQAIQRLHEIRSPTLIIVGERDLPDFHEIANILGQRVPDSRKVNLKGVGHMSNMEAPEEFNEAVLSFLSESC